MAVRALAGQEFGSPLSLGLSRVFSWKTGVLMNFCGLAFISCETSESMKMGNEQTWWCLWDMAVDTEAFRSREKKCGESACPHSKKIPVILIHHSSVPKDLVN